MQLMVELCDALPPTLRHVFSSGEALTLATASAFLRKFPRVRLHNLLATTETSADICVLKDVRLPMVERLLAAGHTHTPIVDASPGGLHGVVWQNELSLSAHEARLVVTGWNVERGYRIGGDPSAFSAATAFSACAPTGGRKPTSNRAGCVTSNRFTSNDRAEWEGPLLMIVGRTDAVVKVRGHRVDLSGVEARL